MPHLDKEKIKSIFNDDWCGMIKFFNLLLSPLFKTFEKGYDDFSDVKEELQRRGIAKMQDFGSILLDDGYQLKLLDVTVLEKVDLSRNRISIQKIIRQYLGELECALMFFHYDEPPNRLWRLSYVATGITKKEDTSAKRYTYVLGKGCPTRTAVMRWVELAKKERIRLSDITNAFSVEALNKEFFQEYKSFYEDFVQYITGKRYIKEGNGYANKPIAGAVSEKIIFRQFLEKSEGDEERASKKVRDYVKKMMGRLIFIQFLQKKGWLGSSKDSWQDGDKEYLQHLFEKCENEERKERFLSEVLHPFFFGMLNNKEEARERIFKEHGWDAELLTLFGKVPFLNGGLFKEEDEDKISIDFPSYFFSNKEKVEKERRFIDVKGKSSLTGKGEDLPYPYNACCGLFDFFSHYNFTIDEGEREEKEIGIDPEMFGKIFENLLEDNKDKGAFYTPKEIVKFMCQKSLENYLVQKGFDEMSVEAFIEKGDASWIKEKEKVLQALKDVKICDPAIGSGAFPMGMLNEIFNCRMHLEGEGNMSRDFYSCVKEDDFSEKRKELSRSKIKKEIILNNIYGVDIEKGACDIARLRFWLSIIVDEQEPIPLPNLDYKIMVGNSLLESFEGIRMDNILKGAVNDLCKDEWELFSSTENTVEELQKAINDYYEPKTDNSKSKIRTHISHLVYTLILERGHSLKNDKLLELKEEDIDSNPHFFLFHVWFSEVFNAANGGFDIIIGNPPYIQLQKNEGMLSSNYKKANFETFSKTGDIYCLFYERAHALLKNGGFLSFITSNKWMRAGYGESLRGFFARKTNPTHLIDFSGVKVFETATVDVNILFFEKAKNEGRTFCLEVDKNEGVKQLEKLKRKDYSLMDFSLIKENMWVFLSPIQMRIKSKVEAAGVPLKDWDIQINYGIKTGCNEAFIISEEKRDEILSSCKTQDERERTEKLLQPILRGRDIKRYGYNDPKLYLINAHNGIKGKVKRINIEEYPQVKKHLDCYFDVLQKRSDQGDTPYNLRDCSYMGDFHKPKIVYSEIVKMPQFYLDKSEHFMIEATSFIMTGEHLDYLIHLLNSKIVSYIFKRFYSGGGLGKKAFRYKKAFLTNLPIPKYDDSYQKLFSCSEKIEEDIAMLYGLDKEEIEFINREMD